MASKAKFTAVLPVLNEGCTIPTSVPLSLAEQTTFQKIRGDDLAVITEGDDEASTILKGGTYTLTIDGFDPTIPGPVFSTQVLALLFSLNVLGNGCPLSVDRAYVIRSLRKTSLQEVRSLPTHHHGNLGKFQIPKGTDLGLATSLYSAASKALGAHPPLRITVSRFNSALGRTATDDKLIDLCIALESIFQSQTEISYQFALYNSLLPEGETEKRRIIFKNLKKLYSQRSDVVHGNKDLDEAWVSANWDDLVRIAKASILRKIDFLDAKPHSEWKEFLEVLALGTDNG